MKGFIKDCDSVLAATLLLSFNGPLARGQKSFFSDTKILTLRTIGAKVRKLRDNLNLIYIYVFWESKISLPIDLKSQINKMSQKST